MQTNQVRALLMGGQACVFYGAAEYSRDTDLAVLCEAGNLTRLQAALTELRAMRIAVPPFEADYLRRGHAIHFRCGHSDVAGLRVDVMSVMRGVDPFPELWERRTTLATTDGAEYDLLALPDLVQAKKTQRDKDWPMLRRLLEAHYFAHRTSPTGEQVEFWFRELRTPALLRELAQTYPAALQQWQSRRPVLRVLAEDQDDAAAGTAMEAALDREAEAERALDRAYWQPLKAELEALRHARGRA